jgi:glycosyltransferase involved in cell wall biosynthesis
VSPLPAVGDKERPRVVQVITKLVVGGSQLTVVGLCTRMIGELEIHLVAGQEVGVEGSLRSAVPDAVTLHRIPSLRREVNPVHDALAVGALRRLLRAIRPDIVHTHGSKAGVVGRLAARGCSARVVHTIHGWGHTPDDTTLRRAVFVRLEQAMARHTDALVAVSRDVQEEGLRCGIGEPSQYVVIPALVNLDPAEPDFGSARSRARAELGISGEHVVVGWVGRFVAQKDPTTLAAALVHVLHSRRDAYAVLVGDGPLRGEVERGLIAEGVGDRVTFTGVRLDARRLYPAFDVVVHPSRWEGQPMVVQEALAERVPVVASRVGGVGDLLVDGGNGYAVTPGNGPELARRTLEVLTDARLRAPLGDEMARRLRAVTGADRCVAGHRELYARLLGR